MANVANPCSTRKIAAAVCMLISAILIGQSFIINRHLKKMHRMKTAREAKRQAEIDSIPLEIKCVANSTEEKVAAVTDPVRRSPKRVLVCVTGAIRTFALPCVHGSIHRNLLQQWRSQGDIVDVKMIMVHGDSSQTWNHSAATETRSHTCGNSDDIMRAIRLFDPVQVKLLRSSTCAEYSKQFKGKCSEQANSVRPILQPSVIPRQHLDRNRDNRTDVAPNAYAVVSTQAGRRLLPVWDRGRSPVHPFREWLPQ